MNAFATDIPVNNIVIDIDSEIVGKTPDDYEDYVSFFATGLQFEDGKYGYEVGDSGVYVFEEEDYTFGGDLFNGEFVEGDTYTFDIYLAATKGYSIPEDATVTVRIDGVTVAYEYFDIYNNGYDCLNVAVDVTAAEPTPINNIVIDIDSEIVGKTAEDYEDYVSFTANGLQFEDGKYGYEVGFRGVMISKEENYDNHGDYFTGEFVGGDTYTFEIYLAATAGYSIPEDATVTVRIDGETVLEEDYRYFDIYNVGGYDCLEVAVDVTAKIPVNNIVIDIDSAIAGKTPDDYEDYVSFTATGLQFRDEKYGYDAGRIGVKISEEDKYTHFDYFTGEFVEGDTYTFEVYLATKEGYSIPEDTTVTVRIDGVTVSDEDYRYFSIFNVDGYDCLGVDVDVTAAVTVTGVALDIPSKTLAVGATQQLAATVAPTDATNKEVTWESSDPAIATVSATGLVTAIAAGTATITVTTEDGNKTATCAITVISPTVLINNNPGTKTINYGDELKLTATANNAPDGTVIVWYVDGTEKGRGDEFTAPAGTADYTVTVKLVDSDNNILTDAEDNEITDEEDVTVKAGFFQKLINFFKNLFGAIRIVPQAFKQF